VETKILDGNWWGQHHVSEELSSVETLEIDATKDVISMFQKNLVVWKPLFSFWIKSTGGWVSEELSSVETIIFRKEYFSIKWFQKNLVVWKPGPMIAESRHKIEFQKNLVVWKRGKQRVKSYDVNSFQKNLVVWKRSIPNWDAFPPA